MPCVTWTLRLEDDLEVLLLSGDTKERQRRLDFQIAKMLTRANRCSWSRHVLEMDVWKWSRGPCAEVINITYTRVVVLGSLSERNEMLRAYLNVSGVETLCQTRLSLNDESNYVECDICQRVIEQAVGKSRQHFYCPGGHVGISRHPGSDDNLNWECAEKLAVHLWSPNCPSLNYGGRCDGVWNEIGVCLSEASACRRISSDPSDIKLIELEWWQLLCADVLAFERDSLLLLGMFCWKRHTTRFRETTITLV